MAIGPVRHGDDARPMTADEAPRRARDVRDPCRCARSGQRRFSRHAAPSTLTRRFGFGAAAPRGVPLLPISPAREIAQADLQAQRRVTRDRPAEADFDVVGMRSKQADPDHFGSDFSSDCLSC